MKGYANRRIVEIRVCSDVKVGKCLKPTKERGCLLGLPRSDRKCVSTAEDVRRLLRLYKANNEKSARDLQTECNSPCARKTIRNRLNEQGLQTTQLLKSHICLRKTFNNVWTSVKTMKVGLLKIGVIGRVLGRD